MVRLYPNRSNPILANMLKHLATLLALLALAANAGLAAQSCDWPEGARRSDGLAALSQICTTGAQSETPDEAPDSASCEHCFQTTHHHLGLAPEARLTVAMVLAAPQPSSAAERFGTPAPLRQLPPRAPPIQ